ncbi:hypothetical protein VTK56DRAFT_6437 [Thermocarpiscus australiensis]
MLFPGTVSFRLHSAALLVKDFPLRFPSPPAVPPPFSPCLALSLGTLPAHLCIPPAYVEQGSVLGTLGYLNPLNMRAEAPVGARDVDRPIRRDHCLVHYIVVPVIRILPNPAPTPVQS